MIAEPKVIPVDPESELGRVLEEAAAGNVVLERVGKRFRVTEVRPDPFAAYDPVRVQQALDQSFGSLQGLDLETFLSELREQRGQDRFDLPGEE
jgi:hypothetical protein